MYTDQAAMVDRFGEQELIELTDRDGSTGAIVSAVLNRAIADADDEIDTYLRSGGYDVPLDPVPEIVSRISADIARYHLFDDQPTETVRQRYEDQIALLKQIASGKASLGTESGDGVGSPETTKPDRVFTRDDLKVFG